MTDRVHPAIWFENLVAYQLKDPAEGEPKRKSGSGSHFRMLSTDWLLSGSTAAKNSRSMRITGSICSTGWASTSTSGIISPARFTVWLPLSKARMNWHTDEAVRAHLEESFEED